MYKFIVIKRIRSRSSTDACCRNTTNISCNRQRENIDVRKQLITADE